MKASELVELLKKEIEIGGDNIISVYADLGVDKEGVHRMDVYENVSVNTAATCSIEGNIFGFVTIIKCKK